MTEKPPEFNSQPSLRSIAMPADTNPHGDIFGGWLLSQMDLAGSVLAIQEAKYPVVTVGIEAMNFHLPVFVGDEVSCYTSIEKIGNTSITINVETWVRRSRDKDVVKVTEGKFTYVAVNETRKPISIKR